MEDLLLKRLFIKYILLSHSPGQRHLEVAEVAGGGDELRSAAKEPEKDEKWLRALCV